jgi:hypothetical protein
MSAGAKTYLAYTQFLLRADRIVDIRQLAQSLTIAGLGV